MDRKEFDRIFTLACPAQNPDEMYWLTQYLEELRNPVVLEIGVQQGGSLTFWWLLLNPSLLIGVDVDPQVPELTKTRQWSWDFEGELRSRDRNVTLIIGDSTDPKTVERVKARLGKRVWELAGVDFLFLDGDHDYAYVKADFDNYSTLVRKGGVVVFHDIGYEGPRRVFEDLKGKTDSVHIWKQGMGYGVWRKP